LKKSTEYDEAGNVVAEFHRTPPGDRIQAARHAQRLGDLVKAGDVTGDAARVVIEVAAFLAMLGGKAAP
jgi:hypothetical protein